MLSFLKCSGFMIESISQLESICKGYTSIGGVKLYEKYKSLLDKTNKTSYQVSKETGISQTAFSNWKTKRSEPG